MKSLLVAFLLIMATDVLTQSGEQERKSLPSTTNVAEKELIRLEEELAQAFIKKDAFAIERIEAEDIRTTQDDGTVTTRQQDIANVMTADMQIESFKEYDFHVRVYLNAAVVTGQYRETGTNKGSKFDNVDRFTDVWLNKDGRWQLVVSQDTLIPRPR